MSKSSKFILIILGTSIITLVIIPYLIYLSQNDNSSSKDIYLSQYNESDGNHVGGIFAKDTFSQPFLAGYNSVLKAIFIDFKTFNRVNIDTLIVGYKEGNTNTIFSIDTIYTKDIKDNSMREIKLKEERIINLNDAFFITSFSGKHPNVVTISSMSTSSNNHHYFKNNSPVPGYISHILSIQEHSSKFDYSILKRFILLQILITVVISYWFFIRKKEE